MDLRDVRVTILVVLGLVTLALSNHKGTLTSFKISSSPKETLRCSEILKVAHWALDKHGAVKTKGLEESATIEKALNIFAEKLDPYKALYTKTEVEDFKAGGKKAWGSLLKDSSCGYFSAWVASSYPIAQQRLNKSLTTLKIKKLKNSNKKDISTSFKKSKTWASNEYELEKRVASIGQDVLDSTPNNVVEAYKGKTEDLLKASLEESILADSPDSSSLLAKSIVGTFDPYTTYLSTSEFEDFYSDLSGGTSGIGIRVRKVPTGLLIEEIVQDSAAAESGKLKKEDIILSVNGTDTKDLSANETKNLLKGPENSQVEMEVSRKGMASLHISITRKHFDFEDAKISSKNVLTKAGKNVKVVSIPNFYGSVGFESNGERSNSSAEDLRKVLEELQANQKKTDSLVLDLRGNPGGFLEEAVSMASFFVGSKPVVGVVEKTETRVLKEEFQEPLYNGKIVLLVDNGTASAAEVLAGALSDLQRAVIVGTPRTYGKGTVQKLFSLNEELDNVSGVLKLTTSVFYSPLGHSPANGGIKSDIELPDSVMATKEDFGTAPVLAIQESKPFLDKGTVLELKLKEAMQKGLVKSLKEMSAARLSNTDNQNEKDSALVEASEIASDLASSSNHAF